MILVALISIAVLFFLFNPQLLTDIWLWLVGLIGPIVALVKKGFDSVSDLFKSANNEENNSENDSKPKVPKSDSQNESAQLTTEMEEKESKYKMKVENLEVEIKQLQAKIDKENQVDSYDGTTITVLRYFDDDETTLGLLFWEDEFFCYTLEDTFREVKIPGKTRIPKGTYELEFYKHLTPLTKKYRGRFSWFKYHIHIKDVKNFTYIYIHCGNNHKHTKGCLLIADGIYSVNKSHTIRDSEKAYTVFYSKIEELLNSNKKVRIKIFDEDWLNKSNLKNRLT